MTNRLTTAYAGSGDITEENAAAILDQLLPDKLGLVLIPKLPKRVPSGSPAQPGLRTAIKWLEKEVGESGTIPVDDLLESLLARSEYVEDGETLHDDLALVMVFDPDSEADVELANAAHDAGIRVVNLAAAGDDLVFEDEVPAEPEVPAAEEPPWEAPEPPATTPAEAVAQYAVTEAVKNATAAGVAAAAQHSAPLALTITVPLGQDFIDALAHAVVKAMGVGAQAAVAAAEAPATESNVTHIGAKPVPTEEDPAGQPPNTVVYYYNTEAGNYRPARGKARASEQRVFLTPEQVQEVKDKRLLA
jgi:hypothetical protein